MKGHEIGETFKYGDVLLKVELARASCSGCYFRFKKCWIDDDPEGLCEHEEFCVPGHRPDHENVIFVEQKTQEK